MYSVINNIHEPQWATCNNSWNSPNCVTRGKAIDRLHSGLQYKHNVSGIVNQIEVFPRFLFWRPNQYVADVVFFQYVNTSADLELFYRFFINDMEGARLCIPQSGLILANTLSPIRVFFTCLQGWAGWIWKGGVEMRSRGLSLGKGGQGFLFLGSALGSKGRGYGYGGSKFQNMCASFVKILIRTLLKLLLNAKK